MFGIARQSILLLAFVLFLALILVLSLFVLKASTPCVVVEINSEKCKTVTILLQRTSQKE